MRMDLDLRLNLMPISFENETFKGYELIYVDPDHLKELREKYRESHVFRRQGDTIQCVPLTESAEALGKEKEFSLKDDFMLAGYLVQSALIRYFSERDVQFAKLVGPTRVIREKERMLVGLSSLLLAFTMPYITVSYPINSFP